MNYRLLIALSLPALFMAVAGAYFLPSGVEPIGWLILFIISGYCIARYVDEEYFLHGLLLGLLYSLWYIVADILFYKHFYINRRTEIMDMENLGITASIQTTMLILYPVTGLVCGSIIGFFAFLFSKFTGARTN